MNSTVTDAAPVAAEPKTEFLPMDKNYRLTGELPAVKQDDPAPSDPTPDQVDDTPAVTVDDPAPSPADTAADSAPATAQEKKGPAQTKTAETSENRYQKLSRENRELREELARQKGRDEGRQDSEKSRETKQTAQPATEAKDAGPRIDELDEKTGKPKYATFDDYLVAVRKYDREEAIKEFKSMSAKEQEQQKRTEAEQAVVKRFGERVEAARKKYADFDEVALSDSLPVKQGTVLAAFVMDSEHGPDIAYHLGSHPEEFQRISALPQLAQARELTKLELTFANPTSTPVPKVTAAPRPPNQLSGKAAVTKDTLEQAAEDGDFDTYAREANARALAKLKKK